MRTCKRSARGRGRKTAEGRREVADPGRLSRIPRAYHPRAAVPDFRSNCKLPTAYCQSAFGANVAPTSIRKMLRSGRCVHHDILCPESTL
ncbi:hypothetical protein RvY_15558 [Ramazzottius varieornatus]|uniref:Uncharacterized protein n=1 Tax=Ramazzottius varieornatus TaxID=947166 RepID=A0A1D1VVC4_RAMVA|nr:hypothetical protein RvY_15558 [Ramazzottius varieornatus]